MFLFISLPLAVSPRSSLLPRLRKAAPRVERCSDTYRKLRETTSAPALPDP
jgi:hypothetical protein